MNCKELIKSFDRKSFCEDVNLHIHTTCSDGTSSVKEILEQAKKLHFKYISITDHNTFNAYKEINLQDETFVISGIEFDCWLGTVFFHLLAYGVDINCEALKPFLAQTKKETEADFLRLFSKRNVKDLISAIHEAGGIAVLAHPACYWCISMDRFVKKLISLGLDGIETYYPYNRLRGVVKFHSRKTAEKLADKYGLIKTGGTDCHKKLEKMKL